MPFRRFTSRLLAVPLASLPFVLSSPAWAATIGLQNGVVTRVVNDRSNDAETHYQISQSDCLQNDVFHFPLTIADASGLQLEVWIGQGSTDCTVQTARTGVPTCTKVFSGPATPALQTIDVRVQDMALVENNIFGDHRNEGNAGSCVRTSGATTADQLTVFFLLISSSVDVAAAFKWSTKIDLVGPTAPTNVNADGASSFIKFNWTINTDTDVFGYRFYCDPPPGGPRDVAVTPATPVDAGLVCTDASSATDAADAGDDAEDASTDSSSNGVTCTSPEGGPGQVVTCGEAGVNGGSFVPGAVPSLSVNAAFLCGEVTGNTQTSAIVDGFTVNSTVAVAVAAIDRVKNTGQLSATFCATTEPVNGFMDLYRKAGGTAGGGFCSMTSKSGARDRYEFLYGSLLLGAVFAHRRRRTVRRIDTHF
jgi:hypothetical protein